MNSVFTYVHVHLKGTWQMTKPVAGCYNANSEAQEEE